MVVGAPTSVVAWVDGRTVRSRDDVAAWTPDDFRSCANALVEALVAIHSVDPDAVGLGDFGRSGGYAARQLRRWSGQWERMAADDPRGDRLHAVLS